MVKQLLLTTLGTLMLFFGTTAATLAAELNARIDRNQVTVEQSFTLTVSLQSGDAASGHSAQQQNLSEAPDFSPLQTNFEILSQSTQSRTQLVNGVGTSTRSWVLQLLPLREGTLIVPELKLGSLSTQPIKIDVKPPEPPGAGGGDLFVTMTVDDTEPFVQSQVVAVIRVYFGVSLLEGNLSSPQSDNVIVERLGEDRQFTETWKGRHYQVLERRFALFPQKSGELALSPVTLNASIPADGTTTRGIFTPSKQVRKRSESIILNVKPKPEGTDGWWLPARSIGLSAQWEGATTDLEVGESLTRVIAVTAEGVNAIQLPEIPVPDSSDFKIYTDQAQSKAQAHGESLQVIQTLRWVMVPQRSGEVVVPEIRLRWFDTIKKEWTESVVEEETLTVRPSAITSEQQAQNSGSPKPDTADAAPGQILSEVNGSTEQPATDAVDSSAESSAIAKELLAVQSKIRPLQQLVVALGALWVVTLILLVWRWKRPARPSARPRVSGMDSRAQQRELKKRTTAMRQACSNGDNAAAASAILDWAALRWPELQARTLPELARQLDSESLRSALLALDASRYRRADAAVTESTSSQLAALPAMLENARGISHAAPDEASGLPSL